MTGDLSRGKSRASLNSRFTRRDPGAADAYGEERRGGNHLLLESINSPIRFTPFLHPVPFLPFASEFILCTSAADIYHLTRACCWFCRPKVYLLLPMGSPSLAQPFSSRRTNTCAVAYGFLIRPIQPSMSLWRTGRLAMLRVLSQWLVCNDRCDT